jgi:hypothetical protein
MSRYKRASFEEIKRKGKVSSISHFHFAAHEKIKFGITIDYRCRHGSSRHRVSTYRAVTGRRKHWGNLRFTGTTEYFNKI